MWTNQFDNTANREAHIKTTGPEIWRQTGGKVDAFTCATGTGGTLAGTVRYLKEISDGRVKGYLADPPGSVLYKLVETGKAEREGSGSITEGIGQGRLTANLAPDLDLLDGAVHIPDAESIKMVYRLLDEEGLYVGASSALNVVAATEVAKRLGKGSTVVTMLCDGAYRYVLWGQHHCAAADQVAIDTKPGSSPASGSNPKSSTQPSRNTCRNTLYCPRWRIVEHKIQA